MTEFLLQSGSGDVLGQHFLPSRVDEVLWGWLPNAASTPLLEIASGETITVDTVSHEGILEDQGRDPVAYLAQFGVASVDVLRDFIDIAASGIVNGAADGPHVVTGPVAVKTAKPGDILKIEVLDLALRAPYGFVSNRHGFGALPGEFPEDRESLATGDVDHMIREGAVSHFSRVERTQSGLIGKISAGQGRFVQFPLNPFLGLMGVASGTEERVHSVPPGDHGGNIDIKHLTAGSTLYLPVQADGGLFYTGDPHFAQGNGEVALTALEAPLRATLRLSVLQANAKHAAVGTLSTPVVETSTHWIPTGMDADLNVAMKNAVRNAVNFLNSRFDVPRSVALAYLSAAADFEVSQVVDAVKGVHCMIRKADFATWA